ncbi:aminodeoxychorismate/anthranilate synthase component II [Francisellaceae bacterium]|nr:aminodeoxychorismate/anthranilate synthase component II [Francisellaceae bacterium]
MLAYIDHYDSFADILIDYFKQLDQDIRVFKTDELLLEEIVALKPDYLVIGPGPGDPQDSSLNDVYHILSQLYDKLPILGVCLGHQIICRIFGATIKRLEVVQHGVVAPLLNISGLLFEGLKNDIEVTRYHSLSANQDKFPQCLNITATCQDGNNKIVMGVEHKRYPIYGLQFHPEAVKTSHGLKMLENFLQAKKKQLY